MGHQHDGEDTWNNGQVSKAEAGRLKLETKTGKSDVSVDPSRLVSRSLSHVWIG